MFLLVSKFIKCDDIFQYQSQYVHTDNITRLDQNVQFTESTLHTSHHCQDKYNIHVYKSFRQTDRLVTNNKLHRNLHIWYSNRFTFK